MVDLAKLNRVWDGIKSGELEHRQDLYFCGTAACIAAWVTHFEAVAKDPRVAESLGTYKWECMVECALGSSDTWGNAQDILGLTDDEAFLLFHPKAPKDIQQKVVDLLNAGRRLEAGYHNGDSYYGDVVSLYGL